MTGEPRWDPGAFADLKAGHDWYDERQPGLGRQLAAEIQIAIAEAARHPLVTRRYEHPDLPAEPEVRKVQLKRFDEYGVVYAVVNQVFWVVAIAHAKRRPNYWIARLEGLPTPVDDGGDERGAQ